MLSGTVHYSLSVGSSLPRLVAERISLVASATQERMRNATKRSADHRGAGHGEDGSSIGGTPPRPGVAASPLEPFTARPCRTSSRVARSFTTNSVPCGNTRRSSSPSWRTTTHWRASASVKVGYSREGPEGRVLIDMSTVSPNISRDIAGRASDVGVAYLRSPVSGNPQVLAARHHHAPGVGTTCDVRPDGGTVAIDWTDGSLLGRGGAGSHAQTRDQLRARCHHADHG